MLALILGSVLAVAGLAYVLAPLMRGAESAARAARPLQVAPEASALEALREIEFDRATGKLSAEDYATLKATYAPRALAELEARDAAGAARAAVSADATGTAASAATAAGAAPSDAAEALIARMRTRTKSCPTHGARPEADAVFCSDCGQYLASACLRCGATVEDPRSRFCGECGAVLAA